MQQQYGGGGDGDHRPIDSLDQEREIEKEEERERRIAMERTAYGACLGQQLRQCASREEEVSALAMTMAGAPVEKARGEKERRREEERERKPEQERKKREWACICGI